MYVDLGNAFIKSNRGLEAKPRSYEAIPFIVAMFTESESLAFLTCDTKYKKHFLKPLFLVASDMVQSKPYIVVP